MAVTTGSFSISLASSSFSVSSRLQDLRPPRRVASSLHRVALPPAPPTSSCCPNLQVTHLLIVTTRNPRCFVKFRNPITRSFTMLRRSHAFISIVFLLGKMDPCETKSEVTLQGVPWLCFC